MPTHPSPAFSFLTQAWTHSNYPSHRQKNSTMQQALRLAIESGMTFAEKDIPSIYKAFRASYWIGEGDEGYYSMAVKAGNTSACVAWESHFGRPSLLWQETSAKPERLHVGSQITWRGLTLRVTSFNDKSQHLVACGFRRRPDPENFLALDVYPKPSLPERVGKVIYSHDNRSYCTVCEWKVTPEGHVIQVLLPKNGGDRHEEEEVPSRRLTIPYVEVMEERKKADARVRATVKHLTSATSVDAIRAMQADISADHGTNPYRHFDLETIQSAFAKHLKKLHSQLSEEERQAEVNQQNEARLQQWLAGESVPINHFGITPHRLRLQNGFVEVTNGNRVPLSEAQAAFAFATRHRKRGWTIKAGSPEQYVGGHRLKQITDSHVTIGCTILQWGEIDRIKECLK